MKKKVTWLLMVILIAVAAQTFCFASSSSQSLPSKPKKGVLAPSRTKTDSNSKYWVLGALFKV